jgi:hypothetical protein
VIVVKPQISNLLHTICFWNNLNEELEDNKGVIIIRISKNNRQHNGQKKSTKGQTKFYKTYTYN